MAPPMYVSIAESARYWYRGKYLANHDGDTVDVVLDLGFHVSWHMRIRMLGINAPELRAPTMNEAILARDFLGNLLMGHPFYVLSHRDGADKYGGRWLGEIFAAVAGLETDTPYIVDAPELSAPIVNVNQLMIQRGLAVSYNP